MSLFRRPQPQRERTPEERDDARRLREARRRGEPDPPRPGEDVEEAAHAEPEVAPAEPEAAREERDVAAAEPEAAREERDVEPAEPEAAHVERDVERAEPEAARVEPVEAEVAAAEPEAARVEPVEAEAEAAHLEAEAAAAEPEVARVEPEAAEPEVAHVEPEAAPVEAEAPAEPDAAAVERDPGRVEPEPAPAARDAARSEPSPAAHHARGLDATADDEAPRTDDWFAEVPTDDPSGAEDWTADHRVVAPAMLAERDGDDHDHDDEPAPPPRAADVPRTPPRLPASSAARRPPRPPRSRYEPRGRGKGPVGSPVSARSRPRRYVLRGLALLALVIVGGAIWFSINLFQPGKGDGHGRVAVRVPAGATARDIGDLLAKRGVVSSGFFFNLRAAIAGKRDDLKAGRFVLAKDMSYMAAIDKLTQNPAAPPTINVTIPEGRSRKETAPLVAKAGLKGSYLKASKHVKGFDPTSYGAPKGTTSLEGFLFPATYELRKGHATARELVSEQLDAFKRNFATLDLSYAKRKNLTPYDVLIIASMIEREAAVPKDRRLISAVIYNRLHDGMALGIDATLRYALNQWTQPLHQSELANPTPYNTRLHTGLPPTPIGNPGLASLEAATNPAHVDYLYYVVKPCGNGAHAFSSTDAQFQRDVQRYNAARDRNGGKSPAQC